MTGEVNFYELLGLDKDATPEQIRKAFHSAARRLHPDVNQEPGQTELFMRVQDAFEILSDPKRRSAYDAHLTKETEATTPAEAPVTASIVYSRSVLPHIPEAQLIYALLEFSPALETSHQTVSPLNISLVIDRSTSMQGERMDMVKSTAIELVRQLRPEDKYSIITFSDRAEVLIPANGRLSREEAEKHIQLIRPGGGTEIFHGLQAGLGEVGRNLRKTRINHLILLTDGRTYGDEEACLSLASQAAAQGIRLTCLGMGGEWNDAFLDELAARTGGVSQYISNPAGLRHFLRDKLLNLNQVFGDQVVLKMEKGPWAALQYAYRMHPDPAPLPVGPVIHLGSILKNSTLSVIMEFIIAPVPDGQEQLLLAKGNISIEIPSLPDTTFLLSMKLSRPMGEPPPEKAPRPIVQALSHVTLYRLQERARQEVQDGELEDAGRHLQRLAAHLQAAGQPELAHTAMMEAERIRNTQAFSQEGDKKIKYGTRALMLPAYGRQNEGGGKAS